jgi:hypothetical protein
MDLYMKKFFLLSILLANIFVLTSDESIPPLSKTDRNNSIDKIKSIVKNTYGVCEVKHILITNGRNGKKMYIKFKTTDGRNIYARPIFGRGMVATTKQTRWCKKLDKKDF